MPSRATRAAERKFKEINEANEVLSDPAKRQQYDQLGANWEAISQAPRGAERTAARSTATPAATSATSSGPPTPASSRDFFRVFFGEGMGANGTRPTTGRGSPAPSGGDGLRRHPGRDGASTGRARPDRHASTGRSRPAPASRATRRPPRSPSTRPTTARPAWSRSTASASRSRSRPAPTPAPGSSSTGRGPGGGDLIVVVRMLPDARFTRRGADLERDLPLTLEEALLGDEVAGRDAQGSRPADDPAGDTARKDIPPLRPGHAAVQGRGLRRPVRQVPPRPADAPVRRGEGRRPDVPPPRRPTQPTQRRLTAARSKREPEMQLDRFTQKAQEAIVAAQATAQRLDSPVLDAEHILSALVEPDDGDPGRDAPPARRRPARRSAASWRPSSPGAPGSRAARCRSIRAPGASSSWPRPRPSASATSTSRPSTSCSRSPRSAARARPCSSATRAGREALLQALQSVRGGQRVTSQNPESTYAALEKYGRDLTDRGTGRQARPGHRPRRRDPAGHPGPVAPDEEQPGPHRRARRRQDGHRRRARPADRPRRRARGAQGQARRLARPRRAHRRAPSSAASSRSG